MKYTYRCGKPKDSCCKLADTPEDTFEQIDVVLPERLLELTEDGDLDHERMSLFWEVDHPMSEDPEILCPACGEKAIKVIIKSPIAYFRGYGYLDKKGCHRDMNLYKLTQDDPYGYMRQSGEVDHMKDQIKKKGRFDPKPKYFVPKRDGSGFTRKDNTINK